MKFLCEVNRENPREWIAHRILLAHQTSSYLEIHLHAATPLDEARERQSHEWMMDATVGELQVNALEIRGILYDRSGI